MTVFQGTLSDTWEVVPFPVLQKYESPGYQPGPGLIVNAVRETLLG
jgi:hypothetical protein